MQKYFSSFTRMNFKTMEFNFYAYGWWISPWVNVKREDSHEGIM